MSNFINNVPAAQLGLIVAQLVREGVTFRASPEDDTAKTYTIELTGGY